MHGSSEEFEIQPDPTTDCGVSCAYPILFILVGNDDMHESS